ncbi:hypothetical protein [Prosthecobacter fluviatilis]|uniref:YXWGXW repeat-containing protein n=1 Tax=Prosthecobacter fluviatilis TaxID=445931 RepID=A0ABW0KNB4_9BACT
MKHTILILSLAAASMGLSSCSTYVDGGGYVAARPGYPAYRRVPPPPKYYSNSWHDHDRYHHDHYRAKPVPYGQWKKSGVNARVNANTRLPLNVNSSTRLGIF